MSSNVYTGVHVGETSLRRLPDHFSKAIAVPISGLVVTFRSPTSDHNATIDRLREIPEIEVGVAGGSKLAIVVDSDNRDRDAEIWNAIQELPGVIDLAVAMIAFDEEGECGTNESIRNE
ncbi:hypothetical protein K227x_38050 [Rubripirellula lacrimiformis]|uniref:Chaperone NapD n=1 Tax=Rubripirellula lacrimiformis TaxID=1930273 RepID=A0A517NE49_9BACT|nr:chaperone NapD [Rubripirellula lacrimiformis]QDT05405.1 hypothetical protein K227x_38050 [Rubripirellula lacrimiformis]